MDLKSQTAKMLLRDESLQTVLNKFHFYFENDLSAVASVTGGGL